MNDDEIELAMPNICRTALAYGHEPLSVAEWMLCIGFDEDTAARIKSVAHKWMYAHQHEWPWHIDKPDNYDIESALR